MKFLVVLVLVGVASAVHQIDEQKKAAALRLLTMDPSKMTSCQSDAECASLPERPKCDDKLKLCKPANAPEFDLVMGECNEHSDCPPVYKCHSKKCHFTGPKACKGDQDCVQGIEGVNFECKENSKSAPGQRCWKKCTKDDECHDHPLMPQEAKDKLGCCQGSCQKKAAC